MIFGKDRWLERLPSWALLGRGLNGTRNVPPLFLFVIGMVPSSMSASLIGRFGSSAFRLSTYCGVDVAHGLVLLFGIGTKALPSWDSRTRRNNLLGGLAIRPRQVQADMRTHLIHRPARDIIPPLGGARVSSYRI
jgi:hypothetical protein